MLNVKDHKTEQIWDPWYYLGEKRRQLLDQGWPGVFRRYLLDELPVERIAERFHATMGRPSKESYMMLGGLVLQEMLDLSDVEVVEQLAFNVQWHYALDITDESDATKYVSERVLRKYRSLAMQLGLDDILFGSLTQKLRNAFGVDTSQQRLDSTQIQSNMKNLGRIGLFVKTMEVFLRNLRRQESEIFQARIEKSFADRFLDKQKRGCFSRVKPGEAKEKIEQLAQQLCALVEQFKDVQEVTRLNSYQQMERVLRENCKIVQEQGQVHVEMKKKDEIPSDSLQNPSDPDVTYSGHKGQGFQVQIMETYQQAEGSQREEGLPDLITYVQVEQAHESDANAVLPAIQETEKRGMKPKEVQGDTSYGSDENVEQSKKAGVRLITPTPPGAPPKGNTMAFREFECSMEPGSQCRCPMGQLTNDTKLTKGGMFVINFDREKCCACKERKRCPVKINGTSASLRYRAKVARLAKRRYHEQTEEFRDKYRWRAGIEATMSRLKSQTGAGRLRVRGMQRVRFTVKLKALGLNILRAASAQASRKRRTSPLFSLHSSIWGTFFFFPAQLLARRLLGISFHLLGSVFTSKLRAA